MTAWLKVFRTCQNCRERFSRDPNLEDGQPWPMFCLACIALLKGVR